MTFLHSGESEAFKASYHATLGLLTLGALAYNVLAWRKRREAHLAANVVLYSALAALEARKVASHLDAW